MGVRSVLVGGCVVSVKCWQFPEIHWGWEVVQVIVSFLNFDLGGRVEGVGKERGKSGALVELGSGYLVV